MCMYFNLELSSSLDGGRGEAESSDGHEVDSHQRNALRNRAALSDSPLHRSMCDSRWRRCSEKFYVIFSLFIIASVFLFVLIYDINK